MNNHIWATQFPGESAKAFGYFEAYRDMGSGRSIQKVGKQLAKNPKVLARLSKQHEWVRRAAAFDAWVSEQKAQGTAKEIIEMQRRHAQQAQSFQEIALLPLKELQKRMGSDTSYYFKNDFDNLDTIAVFEHLQRSFRIYQQACRIEFSAMEAEHKRAQPVTADGDQALAISPDMVNVIRDLIDEQIAERLHGQYEAQPQDKKDPGDEKPVPAKGSALRSKYRKREVMP